jgi:hypothetical protein
VLRNWPVLSVASLTVGTQSVPGAAAYGQSGFTLEAWDGYPPGSPQALNLNGYAFCAGIGNVAVTYTAGYVVRNEPQIIPSASPSNVAVNAPNGSWGNDESVTFAATGTPLTKVASDPAAGQYSATRGIYLFNAADAGKGVLISYSFIPGDVEQACIELIGERYRAKDRIGESSKSIGGQETVSYVTAAKNDFVKELLQPFKRVILC